MEIGLSVPDRIRVLNILPSVGNYINLKIVSSLKDEIGFSADEIEKFKIREDNGTVVWNNLGNEERKYTFDDIELEIIRSELRKLNAENSLDISMISVYEKFLC